MKSWRSKNMKGVEANPRSLWLECHSELYIKQGN
jgi:hypothetical protein